MSNAENAGSAAEQEPNLAPNTDAEPSDPALADTEPTAEATSDAVGDSARTAIATPATPIRGSAAHTATMVRAKSALSPQALEALEQLEEKTLLGAVACTRPPRIGCLCSSTLSMPHRCAYVDCSRLQNSVCPCNHLNQPTTFQLPAPMCALASLAAEGRDESGLP